MPQPPSPNPNPPENPLQNPPSPPAVGGSGTDSSASEFLADPGPAFDPELSPAAPEVQLEDELVAEPEGWREETIRNLLETQGRATHALLRVGPADTETWKHTEDDLRSIAPPLTRMLNRYDATRAAAAAGDEIALGAALATYGARNYSKRRRLLAQLHAQEPEPITGVAADGDVGPDYDAEYQRVNEPPPAIVPKRMR